MRRIFLLFFFVSVFGVHGADLVSGGRAQASVLLPETAGAVERYAAEELIRYVRCITGAEIPVNAQLPLRIRFLSLKSSGGKNPLPAECGSLENDGFVIAVQNGFVDIISRKRRGFLYGVYFLLKQNGVRWFHPGADGEHYTAKASFSVPDGVLLRNPFFATRRFRLHACANLTHETYAWLLRNGLQVCVPFRPTPELEKYDPIYENGGHEMTRLLVGENGKAPMMRLFGEHPEYFGLRGGRRVPGGNPPEKNVSQPCTSNPEVLRRMARTAERDVAAYQGREVLKVLLNDDHDWWCQCGNCRKLDPSGASSDGRHSVRWWRYANYMAETLHRKYPPELLRLNVFAYMSFKEVPCGIRPDPRVIVTICPMHRCYTHSLEDPRCTRNAGTYRKLFENWRKSGAAATTFEYHTDLPGASRYLPCETAWVKDLRFYHRIGMSGFGLVTRPPDGVYRGSLNDYRARNMWYSLWQLHWLSGHFSWNINDDPVKVLDALNAEYYGPAWSLMREYRTLFLSIADDPDVHFFWGAREGLLAHCCEKDGVGVKLMSLLERALERVAARPLYRKRIEREQEYLRKNWIEPFEREQKRLKREYPVLLLTEAPLMNGSGISGAWKKSAPLTDFRIAGNAEKVPVRTCARILADSGNLYFLIDAWKPQGGKVVCRSAGGRDVFQDSHVEIFLHPPEMKERSFLLAFNWGGKICCLSAISSAESSDAALRSVPELAIREFSDRFRAELRIPLAGISAPIRNGDRWQINIGRMEYVAGKQQWSSWSNGEFHGFDNYPEVVFQNRRELIRNGGFEESSVPRIHLQKERNWSYPGGRVPAKWNFSISNTGTAELLRESGRGNFLRISGTYPFLEQGLNLNLEKIDRFKVSAKVRGKGELFIRIYDAAAKLHGNLRREFDTDQWTVFTGVIACPGPHQRGIAFRIHGTLDLDDISVQATEEFPAPEDEAVLLVASQVSRHYRIGEKIIFPLVLKDKHGKALPGRAIQYKITGDGGLSRSGEILSRSGGVPLECSLSVPGFVLLEARIAERPHLRVRAGAAVEAGRIAGATPEPADFDEFWRKQIGELSRRAKNMKISLRELNVPEAYRGKCRSFDVRLEDGILNATGTLAIPAGALPGKHAIMMFFNGASIIGAGDPLYYADNFKAVAFHMNLHDTGNHPGAAEIRRLRSSPEIKGYPFRNADRLGEYAVGRIFLRVVRCMKYLKTRPEWDGKTLIVRGGSLGGAQAIVAAALDPQVTLCIAGAPAMCNHLGFLKQQPCGWPQLFRAAQYAEHSSRRAAAEKYMPYYDIINFAKRVRCETIMSVGFLDPVCPPTSVYAAYNACLSERKSMNEVPMGDHGNNYDPSPDRKPGVFGYGGTRAGEIALQAYRNAVKLSEKRQ